MLATLAQVALGGAVGACCRYLAGVAALRLAGQGFPWGTLAVNVLGSFLMGAIVVALERFGATRLAPLLTVGLLGGFTTFSAFSLDTAKLVERGQPECALIYVAASVVMSISFLWLGLLAARAAL